VQDDLFELSNERRIKVLKFKGHQWQKDRKLLGQAFRKRYYFEEVLKKSNKGMERLLSEIHKNECSLNKGEYIDHHKVIEPIAMKIAFGIKQHFESQLL
jgi:hypothetical protein